MNIAYLNGAFLPLEDAKVSVLDRGFLFGDGIYEYLPSYGGKPFLLQEHLVRLQRSCDAIGLTNPYSTEQWTQLIDQLITKNGGGNLGLYFQITRGVAKRDHAFPQGVAPTVFIMANSVSPAPREQIDNGIACVSMVDIRWVRCDIKVISLLGNVLLRQAAVEAGGVEAVLFRDGFLTEGAASNILVVRDDKLLVPPKDNFILPGITYDLILELCARNAVPFEVRQISEAEVKSADELMMTASGREVVAITKLDGNPVGTGKPGPLFLKLYQLYQDYKAAVQ